MSTTVRSKSSSAKAKRKGSNAHVDRPFDPDILRQARELADRYTLIVRFESEAECFVGQAVELPHQIGAGGTACEALQETRELLVSSLATMIESGHTPPAAGGDAPRTEQVNFRVSVEEKAKLEAAAAREGLTLVDYVRGSALKTRKRRSA